MVRLQASPAVSIELPDKIYARRQFTISVRSDQSTNAYVYLRIYSHAPLAGGGIQISYQDYYLPSEDGYRYSTSIEVRGSYVAHAHMVEPGLAPIGLFDAGVGMFGGYHTEDEKISFEVLSQFLVHAEQSDEAHQPETELKLFSVTCIMVGCLLDFDQDFDGGRISRFVESLSPGSLHRLIGHVAMSEGLRFVPTENDIQEYVVDNPTVVVQYKEILASNDLEAVSKAGKRLRAVQTALAFDREAVAFPYAYIVRHTESGYSSFHLTRRHYKGNLVPGFADGRITSLIPIFSKAVESDAWADFILNMFRSTLTEDSQDHRVFRLWSILETISRRNVATTDSPVLYNGEPIRINSRILKKSANFGRVADFCLNYLKINEVKIVDGIGWSNLDRLVWLHEIRNIVAHEGGAFISARGRTSHQVDALEYFTYAGYRDLEHWVKHAIMVECNKAAIPGT